MKNKSEIEYRKLILEKAKNSDEMIQQKESEISQLLNDNAFYISENKNLYDMNISMHLSLKTLFKDAEEVRQKLDKEMVAYEQSKYELSTMKRQNLVLWKHIKKLRMRRKRAAKK